jgi:predicted DsbA family dithiol-disulfide isomerase
MTNDLFNPNPQVVTVWSDLGCPWGTLALVSLRRAIEKADAPVRIDHRVFPLEFFNKIPTPKPIIDAEIVTISGLLPDLGWRLWGAPESSYPVTMLPAMAAVQAAKAEAVGGLHASDQLDAALRHAYYAESRCVSVPSVILKVAETCPAVDLNALAHEIAAGAGVADIYAQFETARGDRVQGSPQLLTAGGFDAHNPGATYSWTAPPPSGFPRLEATLDGRTGWWPGCSPPGRTGPAAPCQRSRTDW